MLYSGLTLYNILLLLLLLLLLFYLIILITKLTSRLSSWPMANAFNNKLLLFIVHCFCSSIHTEVTLQIQIHFTTLQRADEQYYF